ncbi:SipW-dependent-type signal peptide-containing protein [Glutamicibacter arilaitensis]|uniref:SipW-dependent-type signal peptide-containing protein n=1 Tax=Glutamicibacter arilaitensis TaxID=256701 RepID=UPI0038509E76
MATSTTNPSPKSRKVKALLAGGLVLGVGAAVTLAAWTDQEWTEGLFGSGSFNIQGSTDGTTWAEHESSAGSANLVFDLPASSNLSPSDVVAAPFALQLDAGTTYDATVALASATVDGLNAANLTYGIVQVANFADCNPTATGTTIVPAGTTLGTTTGASDFALTAGTDGAAGSTVNLCFQVTAGEDLVQGDETTAQWQFIGTSVE